MIIGILDSANKSSIDENALEFILAAGITNETEKSAIDTLVKSMKTNGIWSSMLAVYPFVGGTATSCKYNLISPIDSDDSYRLAFSGGWTFSSTGAKPNGTNGYADTFIVPSEVLPAYSLSLGVYSRTQINASGNIDLGSYSKYAGSPVRYGIWQYFTGIGKVTPLGAYPTYCVTVANTNTLGLQIGSRTSSTFAFAHFNGSQIGSDQTGTWTRPYSTISFTLGGENNSVDFGTATVANFSQKEQAFAFIGEGLTKTQSTNFYNIIQTFQTTLGRQV